MVDVVVGIEVVTIVVCITEVDNAVRVIVV